MSEPCKGAEVVTLKWQWVGDLLAVENHFHCNRSVARQSLEDWVSSFLCHPGQKSGSGLEAAQLDYPLVTKCQLPSSLFWPLFTSRSPQHRKTGTHAASVTCLTCFRDMVGQDVFSLKDFTCISTAWTHFSYCSLAVGCPPPPKKSLFPIK